MAIYEKIFDILDKNGPASFAAIWKQINEMEMKNKVREKPVPLSQIKSVISRKKDLFEVENDVVFIREEKDFISLAAQVWGPFRPSYTVFVNFKKNDFYVVECSEQINGDEKLPRTIHTGSVEQFKKEIFRLKIWNWEKDYHPQELVLDGISWYVKLEARGRTYVSEGFHAFPKEWKKFSEALSRLIGINFK